VISASESAQGLRQEPAEGGLESVCLEYRVL
jgi:hypothetical protein